MTGNLALNHGGCENAFWHSDLAAGPAGFYDFLHQVVLLPNICPRPSVVVDHELTHVTLINCSTLGLLQNIASCVQGIGRELGSQELISVGDTITATLVKHSVAVHEAAAWFGTELNTAGFENIRAPTPYRMGVGLLRQALVKLDRNMSQRDQLTFTRVMHIVDAIASYALSPPIVTTYLNAPADFSPERLDRDLGTGTADVGARFKGLCLSVANTAVSDVEKWADWTFKRDPLKGKPPRLEEKADWLPWSRPKLALPLSLRPALDDQTVIRLLKKCCGSRITEEQAYESWQRHNAFYTINPAFDRYSQSCLVERPVKQQTVEVDPQSGEGMFLDMAWIRVNNAQSGGFEGTQSILGTDEILILPDPDAFKMHVSMRMTLQEARHFLRCFADDGGGITAGSLYYDFERCDFENKEVLRGLPHSVFAVIDAKSLWIRLLGGIGGSKNLEQVIIPSKEQPDDFGYLLIKAKGLSSPVIVNPILFEYRARIVSIFSEFASPYGVCISPYNGPLAPWIGACGAAVAGSISAFGHSLEQPKEVFAQLTNLAGQRAPKLTISEKLTQLSAG